MALQTRDLAMVALGVQGDEPPNAIQPRLPDGIHLRWVIARSRGFPRYGFHLFRREAVAGVPRWLREHTGGLPTGPWSGASLDTPLGRVSSDVPLRLTDDFAPSGRVEFDLRDRTFVRFALPSGAAARRMECALGFRDPGGWPPRVTIDFEGRTASEGPNPRREQDPATGEFIVFHAKLPGGAPRPNTHVLAAEIGGAIHTGLACEASLEVSLPSACSYVEATVSGSVAPVTVEAYNEDGSLAGRASSTPPKGPKDRGPEALRIDGAAIVRLVVAGERGTNLLHRLSCQPIPVTTVELTAFAGGTPVAHARASGRPGQTATAALEFDGMDAVEARSAAAALIDVGVVPVADDATLGWAPAPGFPAPLRLPVSHPDYPCTPGATEDVDAARALAAQRVRYGAAGALTTPTPRPAAGTVSVAQGSPVVLGAGTGWSAELAGAVLRVAGDRSVYVVAAVLGPGKLVLTRGYEGATVAGAPYAIADDRFGQLYDSLVHLVAGGAEPPMAARTVPVPVAAQGTVGVTSGALEVTGSGTTWGPELAGLALQVGDEHAAYAIARVDSPTQLTLAQAYAGASASGRPYTVSARMRGADSPSAPAMPRQFPLDLVLLASLQPAFAQMVGLYWVDATAQPGVAYDYLLVGDYDGRAALDPARVLQLLAQGGVDAVDGFVAHGRRVAPAPPLVPPGDVRGYALPDAAMGATDVGLRWDLGLTGEGTLVPGHAIMYHLWRAALGPGEPAGPPLPDQYQLVSTRGPLLVASAEQPNDPPPRALDWPPFPMHAVDRGLADGWYGYQVSGVDVFGRHSAPSAPARWHQWAPAPEPRPWYYTNPPGDRAIHPFAVQVPDFVPPPPPTGVEAYALDPLDPTVVKDAAYAAWWAALQAAPWYQALSAEQRRELVGVRVRWRWTEPQMRQAPDVREFRVCVEPGRLNARLGRTAAVAPAGAAESDVTTTVPNDRAVNAYAGAWLRVGTDTFTIVASEAGSPLRVRVRNVGARDDVRPRPNAPCTVALPPFHAEGRVAVSNGSPTVAGEGVLWTAELAGRLFRVAGDVAAYTVARVDSPTQLTLDRPYGGPSAAAKSYGIRHPLHVDYGDPAAWAQRLYAAGYADQRHVQTTTDADGRPVRVYDVFLPLPDGTFRSGLPLAPSVAEPVVYAQVGVSAADDKTYARDARASGPLSGRFGNEGRVAPPATVFRVRREPPPPPRAAPFPELLQATRPDFDGRSFVTYRWRPAEWLKAHVFRAMDDAVFAADWAERPRAALDPAGSAADRALFPTDARWDAAKVAGVAAELNALNALKTSNPDVDAARQRYRALSNDAWRVLAGLPGNERAFTQITVDPLDPLDPAHADRRGPDSPGDYSPDPGLRAFVDALDGRAVNRYFYRAAYVDGAGNRGPMGLASAPVRAPDIAPPAAPVLQSALATGASAVSLQWLSSPERDLARYRLYRAENEGAAHDPRAMEEVALVAPTPTSPSHPGEVLPSPVLDPSGAARPGSLSYVCPTPPGTWYFRLVAEDSDGNRSAPSRILSARSVQPPPSPPQWVSAARVPPEAPTAVRLTWQHPTDQTLACLVERRPAGTALWTSASGWLPRGVYAVDDSPPDVARAWEYRLRVRDPLGQAATALPTITVLEPS